jgi:hypothetical protein
VVDRIAEQGRPLKKQQEWIRAGHRYEQRSYTSIIAAHIAETASTNGHDVEVRKGSELPSDFPSSKVSTTANSLACSQNTGYE